MLIDSETLARRLRDRALTYELDAQWVEDEEPGEALWRGTVAAALYEVACAIEHDSEAEEAPA